MGTSRARIEPLAFNQRGRDRWVATVAAGLPPGTRILDMGAGECPYRQLFAHSEYRAQDFVLYRGTPERVLKEDWHYGALDYVCDAAALSVASGSIDAVLCTELLEHVPEPIRVLQEIGRILRTGGWAFISAPLGSGLHQQPFHFYGGFTPYFYHHFLPQYGFEVVSVQPNAGFLLHFLQELHRGVKVIRSRRRYPYWHPARWLLRLAASDVLARWLATLDTEIPVEEFTVGFHVEALKVK